MEGPAAISDRDRWDLEMVWHRATCSRNAAKTLRQRPHDLPGVWGRSRVGGPSRHGHPVAYGTGCEFRGTHGGEQTSVGTQILPSIGQTVKRPVSQTPADPPRRRLFPQWAAICALAGVPLGFYDPAPSRESADLAG